MHIQKDTDPSIYYSNSTVNCLYQLFENQVNLTPNNVAVIFGQKVLTYNELNIQSNRLAAFLTKNYTLKPEMPIGIMLERSEKMIISILAILKAGCAYIPLDPNNPVSYSEYICKDSNLSIILTDLDSNIRDFFEGMNFVDLNDPHTFSDNEKNIQGKNSCFDLAYIIYTSGSTGVPKGVMIENASLINKLEWMQQHYPLNHGDTVLQKTNYVFDVSVWEMLWPLITGAKLCLLEPRGQAFPDKIINAIIESKVTIIHFVPTMLQIFLNYLEHNPTEINKLKYLKRVFTSGEALTVKQVNLFNKLLFLKFGTGLTNKYGPTEATIEVSFFNCESFEEVQIVPIGKPVSNTQLYILDENEHILQAGKTGELAIAGIQVARGYVNRPELNKERFIANPLKPSEKLYKTGDKARYLPDGNIEFLGRIDDQVKINGYRVEPGSIEKVILENEHIKECIVALKNINETDELVAYITTDKPGRVDDYFLNSLINTLKIRLPQYMIPAFFVELSVFPVNSNGKVDRKSLPLPVRRHIQRKEAFFQPVTLTEKVIAEIWKNILQIENIGIDDNFFDAGGRSLMIVKVIRQINAELNSNLVLSSLFRLPTIRQLARKIDNNEEEDKNPIILLREGTGDPLFLFPGWRHFPNVYKDFIRNFDGTSPLYGVTYPDDGEAFPYKNLQEYAKHLINQIKRIHSTGPYGLLGHSLGGRIIFEVALQLQQTNNEVNLLAIIGGYPSYPSNGSLWKRKAFDEVRTFIKMSSGLKLKYLRYRIPNLLKYMVIKKLYLNDTYEEDEIFKNMLFVHETYQTDLKYNGDVLLFHENILLNEKVKYKRLYPYRTSIYSKLWRNYINGDIHVKVLDGEHVKLLEEPTIKIIATVIASHLNKINIQPAERIAS